MPEPEYTLEELRAMKVLPSMKAYGDEKSLDRKNDLIIAVSWMKDGKPLPEPQLTKEECRERGIIRDNIDEVWYERLAVESKKAAAEGKCLSTVY